MRRARYLEEYTAFKALKTTDPAADRAQMQIMNDRTQASALKRKIEKPEEAEAARQCKNATQPERRQKMKENDPDDSQRK